MNEPITAIISAIAFTVVTILILIFLIKEGIKYYKNQDRKED